MKRFITTSLFVAYLLCPAFILGQSATKAGTDIPPPPGSKKKDDAYHTSRAFYKTVGYFRRTLRMKRIAFDEQLPTKIGSVIFSRFIVLDKNVNIYAIHVYKTERRTKIKFIPWPDNN